MSRFVILREEWKVLGSRNADEFFESFYVG